MSMDFDRLNALAERWMRQRQAHLERERGSVYFHGQRVARGVLELRRRVTEDGSWDDVLRAAALFHDIGKGIEPHAQSGAALVRGLLREEIPPESLEQVARLIETHGDRRPGEDVHDQWARLLQDADLLDHYGCYGIWMAALATSYYENAGIEAMDRFLRENYEGQADCHRALLNFPESVRIYDEKDAYMREFARRLRVESTGGYCV